MVDTTTQHHRTSKISAWWKNLIILNIVLDVPILFYILTGYQWSCNFNQRPDYIFSTLAGISTLILIWFFNKEVAYNPKFSDITIGMFAGLICIAVCYLSLALPLMLIDQIGSNIEASVPSSNGQRIAELCVINCGDSCIEPHTLRISYRFLPFIDAHISDLKYGSPGYFVPQLKWVDDNTISVTEAGDTTRVFHVNLINFNWKYFLVFCLYIGFKYVYMMGRLIRRI